MCFHLNAASKALTALTSLSVQETEPASVPELEPGETPKTSPEEEVVSETQDRNAQPAETQEEILVPEENSVMNFFKTFVSEVFSLS